MIIDKNGKLFGKVNIIDLIIVLAVVILGVFVALNFTGGEDAEVPAAQKAVIKFYSEEVTDFVLDDTILTVIAGNDKPIKVVYEGNPIVVMGDPLANGDFTNEYLYAEKYGCAIVLAGGNAGVGRYHL